MHINYPSAAKIIASSHYHFRRVSALRSKLRYLLLRDHRRTNITRQSISRRLPTLSHCGCLEIRISVLAFDLPCQDMTSHLPICFKISRVTCGSSFFIQGELIDADLLWEKLHYTDVHSSDLHSLRHRPPPAAKTAVQDNPLW